MPWLLNIKVAHRLGLGFGLVSALMLVICGVGIDNAQMTRRVVEPDLQQTQQQQKQVSAMVNAVLVQDVSIRNVGLLTEPVAMQKHATLAREADKMANDTIAALLTRALSDEERGPH